SPTAMGTAFTYEGQLVDANAAADGLYDFEFSLYDNPDPCYAAQKGNTVSVNEVDVTGGYFTVELDFGSDVFNGDARWLEIAVRSHDPCDVNAFTRLLPRQELTPTPYALQTRGIFVDNAGKVGIGTTQPQRPLHIEDDTDAAEIRMTKRTEGVIGDIGTYGGPDSGLGILTQTPHKLSLGANGAINMTIDPSGNVGIGAAPHASSRLYVSSAGTGLAYAVLGQGNVGVYGSSAWGYGEDPYDDALGVKGAGSRWGVVGTGGTVGGRTGAGILGLGGTGYYAGWFKGDVYVEGVGNGIIFPDGTKQTTAATGGGDITAVYAGTGLSGGGTSGDVTLSFSTSWGNGQYVNEGQANSITGGMVVNDTITASDIATNGVGTAEIAWGAVGASEIADNSIFHSDIGTDGVRAAEIAADAVGSSEIAANAVGSSEIASSAVGSSEIADNSITQSDIATDGVGAVEIAAAAVGASEIASASVGRVHLSTSFKAQFVRVDTTVANQYIWDDDWYAYGRPDIRTTGAGQVYIDTHGGVALNILIKEDGVVVVNTGNEYTYTHAASDGKLLEIYVWPYTFNYMFFVHFTGAREGNYIAGLVKAGRG
ncbi:MAG: hypothetical protein ACYS29_18355, partial [Planctomycetota bacterium]